MYFGLKVVNSKLKEEIKAYRSPKHQKFGRHSVFELPLMLSSASLKIVETSSVLDSSIQYTSAALVVLHKINTQYSLPCQIEIPLRPLPSRKLSAHQNCAAPQPRLFVNPTNPRCVLPNLLLVVTAQPKIGGGRLQGFLLVSCNSPDVLCNVRLKY